jgi:hypothetical protein
MQVYVPIPDMIQVALRTMADLSAKKPYLAFGPKVDRLR